MGKKSRLKKEAREELYGPSARKLLKELMRESKPEPFVINDKVVYFNPLKKLLEGEKYISTEGASVTKDMVKQYQKFLKARYNQEKLAKKANLDMNKIDEVKLNKEEK